MGRTWPAQADRQGSEHSEFGLTLRSVPITAASVTLWAPMGISAILRLGSARAAQVSQAWPVTGASWASLASPLRAAVVRRGWVFLLAVGNRGWVLLLAMGCGEERVGAAAGRGKERGLVSACSGEAGV